MFDTTPQTLPHSRIVNWLNGNNFNENSGELGDHSKTMKDDGRDVDEVK